MKTVILSAATALILSAGVANAESFLGSDVDLYGDKSAPSADFNITVESPADASSTFDGRFEKGEKELPSVSEQRDSQIFGPR